MKIHPEGEKVAICCDNIIVTVCDILNCDNAKVIYHDRHMHSNYVRGLAWDLEESKTLHTLGWDGEIKTHHVIWD
ncbi:hypothetical protein evm_005328 [Chilo suppressalis]|nr:hypothetical protein evm_005328 [Chilo suppressalis]